MTVTSPTFLVFDSGSTPSNGAGGVIYCALVNAKVQWPKTARRGRPRKYLPEDEQSSNHRVKSIETTPKQQYGFVVCSNGRQPRDPNVRKFVRTHVMQNYQRQQQISTGKTSSESQDLDLEHLSHRAATVDDPGPSPTLSLTCWSKDPFDTLPITMEPYMHDLLLLYATEVAPHAFPIEAHWGFNPLQKLWIPLALTDAALLHSILFCSDQFEAKMTRQKERPSAVNHLKETIRILNHRLQDPSHPISDSTIAAVAVVAITELSSNNHSNWLTHMTGLKRMMELRGGLSAFENSPILHDKIYRADLWGSIHNLSTPYLSTPDREIRSNNQSLAPGFQALHTIDPFSCDFLDVLHDFQIITTSMNTTHPQTSETTPLTVRKTIQSVQYCLLHNEAGGNQLENSCRLGILLYLGILQNEFWIPSISVRIISQLKYCLQSENLATPLRLWLLFLAGSVVTDVEERLNFVRGIRDVGVELGLKRWCDVKTVLESFAWTREVQDKSGSMLWDNAMRGMECHVVS